MIFFYAIFPWVYKFVMGIGRKRLACCMLTFAVCYICVASAVPDDMVNCTLYVNPLLRSVDFALGVLLYRFYKLHQRGRFAEINFWTGAVVNIILMVAAYVVYEHLGLGIRCAALFWFVIPVLLYSMLISDGSGDLQDKILGSRCMVNMGDIGFEFFMSHTLVLRVLHQTLFAGGGGVWYDILYLATALIITIGLSLVLHRFVVRKMSDGLCRCLLCE